MPKNKAFVFLAGLAAVAILWQVFSGSTDESSHIEKRISSVLLGPVVEIKQAEVVTQPMDLEAKAGRTVADNDVAEKRIEEPFYLLGAVQGESGDSLANAQVKVEEVYLKPSPSRNSFLYLTTDDAGRFRYPVNEQSAEVQASDQGTGQESSAQLDALKVQHHAASGYKLERAKPVHLPAQPQDVDLGVFRLMPVTPLAAGHVVDSDQKAIPDARIKVFWKPADGKSHYNLPELAGAFCRSHEDGGFVIYTPIPKAERFEIRVEAKGYQPLVHSFQPGDEDLHLVMFRAARLTGLVLVDEGMKPGDICLNIQYADGRRSKHFRIYPEINEEGKFELDLEVQSNADFHLDFLGLVNRTIYKSQTYRLLPNEVAQPAELNSLDFRDKFIPISIHVRNEDGEEVNAMVNIFRDGRSMTTGSHRAKHLVAEDPLEKVMIGSRGYIGQTLHNVEGTIEVVLKPALKVWVEIPPKYLEYREGISELRIFNHKDPNTQIYTEKTDDQGRTLAYFPKQGTYTFVLYYSPRFGSRSMQSRVGGYSAQKIEVNSDGQSIALEVDQAALDQLVDKLLAQAEQED
jgi:hypothetical protein